ncbi:TraR/DksA C4-type zinc finger protein [Halomonas janggokensis]|uniref:TraR/DksA C4-type zinc finger protein n=1 Tax=Vreelandella janggokensis TaxID=370767 RepID=A0ABT4IW82_9GAMM|nr:TraR/DksA C4-type zinc finger protein [Halomonas janggokensis]MCZ0927217.1 TraR/DksA C4-type zinc finger protein [Halomonas janggokensis]MCZ0929725.1 TraR/DksA C4-type zinc finger protein [Halomonas janggokensis]
MHDQGIKAKEKSVATDKVWAEKLLAMPDSDYMNDEQLAFFRQRLLEERDEIEAHLQEIRRVIASHERDSDEADQAAFEEELSLALRQADRESRLLNNIAAALKRIESGDYGYCDETREPIGLARLMFRPTAKLCIEAKERQEQHEHHYRKARWG